MPTRFDGRYVWLADVVDELLDVCEAEAEAVGEARWLAALRRHFENSDLLWQTWTEKPYESDGGIAA